MGVSFTGLSRSGGLARSGLLNLTLLLGLLGACSPSEGGLPRLLLFSFGLAYSCLIRFRVGASEEVLSFCATNPALVCHAEPVFFPLIV